MTGAVWIDGDLRPPKDAAVSVADRGLTLGEGLFETMRWEAGAIRRFQAHWARLSAAAAALGLPLEAAPEAIHAAALALVADHGLEQAALRLTLTGGEGPRGLAPPAHRRARILLSAAPLALQGPVRLATVEIRRNPGAPTARFKTLSYLDQVAALAEAKAAGGDEALMLNLAGRAASAAAATLIVITAAGEALTPPVAEGALPGVTRGALLATGAMREALVTARDLADAVAIGLCNALTGVRPALSLDGRALAADHPTLNALIATELSSA
jgi:branched-chain amino acid aminotransferase